MKLTSTLIQMRAWLQDEVAFQEDLCTALEALEAAVRQGDTATLCTAGEALEAAVSGNVGRERRRLDLLGIFARIFEVPRGSLTLTAIAERAVAQGEDVTHLIALRDRLKETVSRVVERARHVSVLARHHQGVLRDLFTLLSHGSEAGVEEGCLVDAEV